MGTESADPGVNVVQTPASTPAGRTIHRRYGHLQALPSLGDGRKNRTTARRVSSPLEALVPESQHQGDELIHDGASIQAVRRHDGSPRRNAFRWIRILQSPPNHPENTADRTVLNRW